MKLEVITRLNLDVDETDVYIEVQTEGGTKEVAAVKARQVVENGRTRVVLVPAKPRGLRASRTRVVPELVEREEDQSLYPAGSLTANAVARSNREEVTQDDNASDAG